MKLKPVSGFEENVAMKTERTSEPFFHWKKRRQQVMP
jgi:hypothetical protein